MDIAALSMAMSQASIMQQCSLAATKNAMNVVEQQMQGIVDMMETASPPSFGHQLDIKV